MLNKRIFLAGYSGHGYVVVDTALKSGLHIQGYTDPVANTKNFFNLEYMGCETDRDFQHWQEDISFILGVGNNNVRQKITKLILGHKKEILNVIHPTVDFSEFFSLGFGNFLAKNISVTPLVDLGNCNILNTGCVVDHECKIGDFVHIGPGAVLAGNVSLGDGCFVGANAVIREGVHIGQNAIVGAGAVVISDVAAHTTVVGNPAKFLN